MSKIVLAIYICGQSLPCGDKIDLPAGTGLHECRQIAESYQKQPQYANSRLICGSTGPNGLWRQPPP